VPFWLRSLASSSACSSYLVLVAESWPEMSFWKKGSGQKSASVLGRPHVQPWAAVTRFLARLTPLVSWEKGKESSACPIPTKIFPCLQKEGAGKGEAQPGSRCVRWLRACWQRAWERFRPARRQAQAQRCREAPRQWLVGSGGGTEPFASRGAEARAARHGSAWQDEHLRDLGAEEWGEGSGDESGSSIAARTSVINAAKGSPGAAQHTPPSRQTELQTLAETPGERLAPRRLCAWDRGAGSARSNPQRFAGSAGTSPNLPLARRLRGPCPSPWDRGDKVALRANRGEAGQGVGELATWHGRYPCGLESPLGEPFPPGMSSQMLAAAPFSLRAWPAPALGKAEGNVPFSLRQHIGWPAEGEAGSCGPLQVQQQLRTVASSSITVQASPVSHQEARKPQQSAAVGSVSRLFG